MMAKSTKKRVCRQGSEHLVQRSPTPAIVTLMVNRFVLSLRRSSGRVVAALLLLFSGLTARADGIEQTPLATKDLDPAALAEWIGGSERPLPQEDGQKPPVWTRDGRVGWGGRTFARSSLPGVRHLPIGPKRPTAGGTGPVRAG